MIVVVCPFLLPRNIVGLTMFPFVILRCKIDRNNVLLLNHEKIHLRQQLELLVFPFYLWYFFDFLRNYVKYKNANTAYLNIVFEKEAYAMEGHFDYLKKRKLFAFYNFFKIYNPKI